MKRFIQLFLISILLPSCAGLTQQTSSIPTDNYGRPNDANLLSAIEGKNPNEVKDLLGKNTIYEGYKSGSHGVGKYTKDFFVLIYNQKPSQMLASYNLDDLRKCVFITFPMANDYKVEKATKLFVSTGQVCLHPYFERHGFEEISSEEFMKKVN